MLLTSEDFLRELEGAARVRITIYDAFGDETFYTEYRGTMLADIVATVRRHLESARSVDAGARR